MTRLNCTEENTSFLEVLCQEGKLGYNVTKNVTFQIRVLNLIVNCTMSEVVIATCSLWIANVPGNIAF
uniref:CNNM transmembrane domain-containing protein n=1 Tax=Schistosoma mansoni TaxID=6183 RepID=A0A5K4F997_SCHMA